MSLRTILNGALLLALSAFGVTLPAQEHPAKRVASIVSVAIDEYGKGIDAQGRIISELEYQEAVDFLADARQVAGRISGDRAVQARLVLDSIIVAVAAKRPPAELAALHERFGAALGTEAALDMPTTALDIAAGARLFAANCAACHGEAGRGAGPLATGMVPEPPAIGTVEAMHDVSPGMAFRIVSVGVKGTPMAGYSERLSVEERWNIVAYLTALRASDAQRLEGEGLFLQRCASCHGPEGAADGAYAGALTKLPPELGSLAWQAERSDAQLASVVRGGLAGTAMPASTDLTDAQVASVVAYVRTLPVKAGAPVVADARERDAAAVARTVLATLDGALTAARAGRNDEAADKAFDAYIAFEPLEATARGRSPGLVANVEQQFADFKGALRAGDLRRAEAARNTIEATMPAVLELTRPAASGWGAFVQSFLIILREGVEAILVIGAIVAFLMKTGNREKLRAIWLGVGLALAASAVTAVVLQTLLRAMPATREVVEGVTMLIAVAVLFSVSYWLISKVEAAKWQRYIKEKVSTALEKGGGRALALVAFLAVYREGAETALFYQALFSEGPGRMFEIVMGIVVGAVVLAVIFTLFYRYGVKIPLRPFFAVTSVLLYYMAFVFAGKGVRELQEGNVVPITVIPGFPHVDALGIFPSVETLLAQLVLVLLFVFALVKTFWPRRSVALPTVPPEVAGAPAASET